MNIKNAFKHFKLICIHKKYVFQFCLKAGIPFRGLVHDFSKFSPKEFIESVKYFTGTHSPIDECKSINGYSLAWQHHKGRNTHHYEYWMDNFDKGGEAIPMPFDDAVEMVCDYLGAGKAYLKKNFTYKKEYEWWIKKSESISMHKETKQFVEFVLFYLQYYTEQIILNKNYLIYLYELSKNCNSEHEIDNASDRLAHKYSVVPIYRYNSHIGNHPRYFYNK